MNIHEIHPYYHPTTVVLVDDNQDFLANLMLQMDPKLVCRVYSSPARALDDINSGPSSQRLDSAALFRCVNGAIPKKQASLIELDLSVLSQELENPDRFSENSVVVVDYNMPEINGLNFCRSIKNKRIKKILITGTADEKLAVQAFNEGIIDKFVLKGDGNATGRINDYVRASQHAYFRDKTAMVDGALSGGQYSFLADEKFVATFHGLCRDHDIVEYYMSTDPCGFILLAEAGTMYLLLVYSEEELKTHADIIKDQQGPVELYDLVTRNQAIPYFDSMDGYYTQGLQNWKDFVYPATRLHESSNYYYALVANPVQYRDLAQRIYKHDEYLKDLDQAQE